MLVCGERGNGDGSTPYVWLSNMALLPCKLPEKEFRIMMIKMIKNLENKVEKKQESINKDLEELKNKHMEKNNKITEIKNTQEGINSRVSEAEEQISELEDKMV